ncbi:MAG: carboxypeptidase-like regulatory domain-containing protein [Flavobacteriaceae bacterium]|nr:carboxypeptidase-like regulatory domain-containing protein [Flavobacteriaceae bacterium]
MRVLILLLVLSQLSFGQVIDNTKKLVLKGKIIDNVDSKPLQSADILNLNSVVGTTTNRKGQFEITAQPNDTLFISYIGYQSIKLKVTNDLLKGNELLISMFEKVVDLDEVTLKPYQLIGVLVVDAKNVPLDKFSRIHINGISQTYEIGRPVSRNYGSVLSALFNPIDFWYKKLGKKPKQLKRLQKLKEKDNLREIMQQKFSREVLMDYMDMSKKELNDLLDKCNYSEYFIKKASDLQIIEAVLECYENYKALKKGKVGTDFIPDKVKIDSIKKAN